MKDRIDRMNHKSQNNETKGKKWNLKQYPYQTNYNDHFETPLEAYQDVATLLKWLHENSCQSYQDNVNECNANNNVIMKRDIEPILYDPYYCSGRTKVLLQEQLGYQSVVHDKRDFYNDIECNMIPIHDILITNPPYSDTHKEKCLDFCFRQLRSTEADNGHVRNRNVGVKSRPFLLLMPNYVASKQYYRDALQSTMTTTKIKKLDASTTENEKTFTSLQTSTEDVVYLIPQKPYNYEHPESTGKDSCPFQSIWYCGIGRHLVNKLKIMWSSLSSLSKPILVTSLAELEERKITSFQNRPNPKQRRKSRMKRNHDSEAEVSCRTGTQANSAEVNNIESKSKTVTKAINTKRKSKYRDDTGGRARRRF